MPDEPSDQPDSDLPLPDRFTAAEAIGRSASATVYRAHDRELDRQVAVKLFQPDPDPLTLRRAEREGRTLARLSHPGLVSIFDSGVHQDRPYLVMQLISGQSLQSRLLAGALPEADAVRMTTALAEALAHIHSRSVIHRDVKPANILLDTADHPHLGDFGIALVAGQARLTRHDEIVGTPAYLAPEQIRGSAVGPAADIYALGLVLLECLTGEVEYAGADKIEAALARLHRPPRVPAGIDPALAALLAAMTDGRPDRRPTAQRCAAALRAASAATMTVPRAASVPARRARSAGAPVRRDSGSPSATVSLKDVLRPLAWLSPWPVVLTTGLLVALAFTVAQFLFMLQPPPAGPQSRAESGIGQTTRQPPGSPGTPTTSAQPTLAIAGPRVTESQVAHQPPPVGTGPVSNAPASHVPPGQGKKPAGSHQPPGHTKAHN